MCILSAYITDCDRVLWVMKIQQYDIKIYSHGLYCILYTKSYHRTNSEIKIERIPQLILHNILFNDLTAIALKKKCLLRTPILIQYFPMTHLN